MCINTNKKVHNILHFLRSPAMELEAPSAHIVEAISELDPCNRVSTSENCPSSKVIMRKVVLERAARG